MIPSVSKLALLVLLVGACTPPGTSSGSGSSSSSSSSSSSGGPLTVPVHTSGALGGENIRAQVSWSTFAPALTDCLAPIEVRPLLNPGNPQDRETLITLSSCFNAHVDVSGSTHSVPLGNGQNFDVLLGDIPAPALVTGQTGGQLSMGTVLVYRDGNDNGLLDMLAPGTRESVDTVLGGSYSPDTITPMDIVVFRHGELSPLWKIFVGMYGCVDEPGQGVSVVSVRGDLQSFHATCTVSSTAPVEVVLSDSAATRSMVCIRDQESAAAQEPTQPIPAGAEVDCLGAYSLTFNATPGAVCPITHRYDLAGCRDNTSSATCEATSWSHYGDVPSWWPCRGGDNSPRFALRSDSIVHLTYGPDQLLVVEAFSGPRLPLFSEVVVEIGLNDAGDVARFTQGHGLTLVDADGDGALSLGDTMVVTETAGEDFFNPDTPYGLYPVDVDFPPYHDFTPMTSLHVNLPALLPAQDIPLEDGAPLTSGLDHLFTLRYPANGSASYLLSELSVSVQWSCRATETSFSVDNLELQDLDGDGRFGPGDGLVVKESGQATWPEQGTLFQHCVWLHAHRGFNWGFDIGYALWAGARLTAQDAPQALTSGADALFSLTLANTEQTFAPADLGVHIWLQNGAALAYTVGNGVTLVDANGDGRFGAGDRLDVAEVTAVPELSTEGQWFAVDLAVATPTYEGYGVWTNTGWTSGP